jgi:hypothetical protein
VIVGTLLALIFKVLVEVALLKVVIVPELERFTIPPALFVIPAIVPEPPKLIVPVLVKFATIVDITPDPVIAIVPAFDRVLIDTAPEVFRVPLFVNDPPPPIVNVPVDKVAPELIIKLPKIVVLAKSEVVPALIVTLLNEFKAPETLAIGKVFVEVRIIVPDPSVKTSVLLFEVRLAQLRVPPKVMVIVPNLEVLPVLPNTTAPETVNVTPELKVIVPAPPPPVVLPI